MKINIPISAGELIDKLTILELKRQWTYDTEKLKHILHEKSELEKLYKEHIEQTDQIISYRADLYEINRCLWMIEDRIRKKENLKEFDEEFVELARDVYITNDKRFEAKNKINNLLNSEIKEMKSYESYS
jgi:DNA repair ATPase RecN